MKKLLSIALATSLISTALTAVSISEQFNAFLDLEKGHKFDWLDLKVTQKKADEEIKKKHMGEWIEFKKKSIQELEEGKKLSFEHLKEAIGLHKAQKEDWKKLNSEQQKAMLDLAKKHEIELAAFEKSLGKDISITVPPYVIPQ